MKESSSSLPSDPIDIVKESSSSLPSDPIDIVKESSSTRSPVFMSEVFPNSKGNCI